MRTLLSLPTWSKDGHLLHLKLTSGLYNNILAFHWAISYGPDVGWLFFLSFCFGLPPFAMIFCPSLKGPSDWYIRMPSKNGASSDEGTEFATRTLNPLIRCLPRMISTLLTSSSEIRSGKEKACSSSKGAPVVEGLLYPLPLPPPPSLTENHFTKNKLSGDGGVPQPLNGKSFCQKKLSRIGGIPLPIMKKSTTVQSIWQAPYFPS